MRFFTTGCAIFGCGCASEEWRPLFRHPAVDIAAENVNGTALSIKTFRKMCNQLTDFERDCSHEHMDTSLRVPQLSMTLGSAVICRRGHRLSRT
jgi:hypothetical protein